MLFSILSSLLHADTDNSINAGCKPYLSIKRKVIKSHGTDEVDVSGLTVHDLLIPCDPQPGVFGEDLHNLSITMTLQ